MVWTAIGWIDQGEDLYDFEDYKRPRCKECFAWIPNDPQIVVVDRFCGWDSDGKEIFYPEEIVWWECPRCMAEYDEIEKIMVY